MPVVYQLADENSLKINKVDGSEFNLTSLKLEKDLSKSIFERNGEIERITVNVKSNILK